MTHLKITDRLCLFTNRRCLQIIIIVLVLSSYVTELPKVTVCLLDAITSGAQGLHRIMWIKGRVICGNPSDGICLDFCLFQASAAVYMGCLPF